MQGIWVLQNSLICHGRHVGIVQTRAGLGLHNQIYYYWFVIYCQWKMQLFDWNDSWCLFFEKWVLHNFSLVAVCPLLVQLPFFFLYSPNRYEHDTWTHRNRVYLSINRVYLFVLILNISCWGSNMCTSIYVLSRPLCSYWICPSLMASSSSSSYYFFFSTSFSCDHIRLLWFFKSWYLYTSPVPTLTAELHCLGWWVVSAGGLTAGWCRGRLQITWTESGVCRQKQVMEIPCQTNLHNF